MSSGGLNLGGERAGGPSIETLVAQQSSQALFDAFAAQERAEKNRHKFNCSHVHSSVT